MITFRAFSLFSGLCLLAATEAQAQSAVPAPPAPWRLLASTPELAFSVDTTRAVLEGPRYSVWIRFDYGAPQSTPEVDGGPFQRTEVLVSLECGQGRSRDVRMQLYHASGKQLVDYAFPEGPYTAIARHPMRTYYEALCGALRVVPPAAG